MIIPIQVTLQAVSYSSVVNILSATVALKLKIHIKALVAYTISCEFLTFFVAIGLMAYVYTKVLLL